MENTNPNNHKNGMGPGALALGVMAGVVAGVIGGILLAPKSGEETRKDLGDLTQRMKDQIADRLSKVSRITKTAYHEIVDAVVKQYEDAKEITSMQADELKKQLGESYDKVKEAAREEGREVADDMTPDVDRDTPPRRR